MRSPRKTADEIPEVFERCVVASLLDEIGESFCEGEREDIEREIADYLDVCCNIGPGAIEVAKGVIVNTLMDGISLIKSADVLADLLEDKSDSSFFVG